MANTDLTYSMELTGRGQLKKAVDLSVPLDSITFGQSNFDQMLTSLTFGTSSSQANQWWHDERSILTTANDDLDLAGGLTSVFGETITFAVIKVLIVAIDAADGSKKLRVGPQNVTNGWQGPWGGVGATVYTDVFDWAVLVNDKWTGCAVTAGTGDILRINNPTGGTVTYRILIIGEV